MNVSIPESPSSIEATLPRPGSWGAYLIAARPRTLTASISPVLVGAAMAWADQVFGWLPTLAALSGAIGIQIGTNIANDLNDFLRGNDSPNRVGPPRAGQSGLLTPRQLRVGIWMSFSFAALCGLYLALKGGWPIAVVGILAIASGVAYTAGPYPLGYLGLGDLFVFIFFGPVAVGGTYFVQAGVLTLESILASVPVGLLTTAILVVNDVRDIRTDAVGGKRTLSVRFGLKFGRGEYIALLILGYSWLLLMVFASRNPWLLIPWISFPWGVWLMKTLVSTEPGPALNAVLIRTAKLLLAFCLLLAAGLIMGRGA